MKMLKQRIETAYSVFAPSPTRRKGLYFGMCIVMGGDISFACLFKLFTSIGAEHSEVWRENLLCSLSKQLSATRPSSHSSAWSQ